MDSLRYVDRHDSAQHALAMQPFAGAALSLWRLAVLLQVTVSGVVGTGRPVFIFDSPLATDIYANAAQSGFTSLTVSGLNFGCGDHTATAAVALISCATSSWISATSLACRSAAQTIAVRGVATVSVGSITGTGQPVFSFDAPAVSNTVRNSPITGMSVDAATLTVSGTNFGTASHRA
jgi:hypothetical protein